MDDKNQSPTTKFVRVQVVLDDETKRMVKELVEFRSTPDREYNKSSIIRKIIRAEHRRETRRQQQLAERQAV